MNELDLEITDGESLVGGGSTPAQSLQTKLIRIKSSRYSAAQLEQRLRRGHACTPVIARVEDDRVILDFRTVFAEQESALAESLAGRSAMIAFRASNRKTSCMPESIPKLRAGWALIRLRLAGICNRYRNPARLSQF